VSLARVSFIIPVLNEAAAVAPLLLRLRETYPGAELIVVDGGSTDNTAELAAPLCDELLACEVGRAKQMNRGAAAARGDYYLFLHADSTPSVTDSQLQEVLADRPAWGFCKVRLAGSEAVFSLISCFMNLRSTVTRVSTGDQMQFVRADVFAGCDGYHDIPLMEDISLSKSLRKLASPRIISQVVLTSSRRWRERGVVRTVLTMWGLRLAYFLGVSPQRLWRVYYGG
jgi:rSAM/selenodomain-associated transferase 2